MDKAFHEGYERGMKAANDIAAMEIEEVRDARDTYWKERVEMSIGGINFRRQIKGAFEDYAHAHPEVPQFNSDVRRGIEKRLHANIRTLVLSKITHKDI